MIRIDPFVDSFYLEENVPYDKEELIKFSELLEQNDKNVNISNRGGFQSIDFTADGVPEQLFPIVSKGLELLKPVYHNTLKMERDPILGNVWINVNRKNNYNVAHIHPDSIFSAVFYVKVPSGDAGNLVWRRGGDIQSMWAGVNNNITTDTSTFLSYNLKPKEGNLIMFPSYISHYVDSNLTDEEDDRRISIAINYG